MNTPVPMTGFNDTAEVGLWAWHIYHDSLAARLTEPLEFRFAYIRVHKPPDEQAVRNRLLRIVRRQDVLDAYIVACDRYRIELQRMHESSGGVTKVEWEIHGATIRELRAAIDRLHEEECPDCPWDGRTIFPERDHSAWSYFPGGKIFSPGTEIF